MKETRPISFRKFTYWYLTAGSIMGSFLGITGISSVLYFCPPGYSLSQLGYLYLVAYMSGLIFSVGVFSLRNEFRGGKPDREPAGK